SCLSSSTSLKARANSLFVMLFLLHIVLYKQKSGGCPLFDAFGIDASYKEDSSTPILNVQGFFISNPFTTENTDK
ncbi:MAG: hypothetical protein AB8I58_19125, partial [Anaerolineales bacterium]